MLMELVLIALMSTVSPVIPQISAQIATIPPSCISEVALIAAQLAILPMELFAS